MQKKKHEYEIGKDIFITSNMLHRYLEKQRPSDDVTGGQGRILGFIIRKADAGEKLYQKDIEKEFQIRGSSVTSIIKLMESRGLICRESSKEDARLKSLLPTDEGRKVHDQICETIYAFESKMLGLFTADEVTTFQEMMKKLREFAIEEEDSKVC